MKGVTQLKRSLDIPDKLNERLVKMAEQKSITVAAVIKIACTEYLDREEKK